MSDLIERVDLTNPGFMNQTSTKFDAGVENLQEGIEAALNALVADPSNPKLLSDYQAIFSDYTLYRNAQSGAVKAYKDVSSAIISNFR